MPELDPAKYTVAWIAPLEIEARAAWLLLDNHHPGRFPISRGDDYVFRAGDVCGHNVIIATLPAGQEYGTGSAAALASQVKRFFPNLWFGLLVGVAAGLPNLARSPPLDIRLGDVLVGLPEGDNAGLISYELGKETAKDGFQLLHFGRVLAVTETVVRSAIGSLQIDAPNETASFLPYYEQLKTAEHRNGSFLDPGQENDVYHEVNNEGTERRVERPPRPASKRTRVWYGPIGSGDKLMKNSRKRNELRDKYNIIGLEMEAAGTMNRIPVGVIRGVCDYGDEHKNKQWQPYAAAMAAAYAKAILNEISPKTTLSSESSTASRDLTDLPTRSGKRSLESEAMCTDNGRSKRFHSEQELYTISLASHKPSASTTFSSADVTQTTANTQPTAQTSLNFQQGSVHKKDVSLQGVNEVNESTGINRQLHTSTGQDSTHEADQASLSSSSSTVYTAEQQTEAVRKFSQAMLKQLASRTNYAIANSTACHHILPHISEALKQFTESIEVDKSVREQVKGVKLVRRLRLEIAREFHDSALIQFGEADDTAYRLPLDDNAKMNFLDKVNNWASKSDFEVQSREPNIQLQNELDKQSSIGSSEQDDVEDDTVEHTTEVVNMMDRILEHFTAQPAFEQLIGTVERQIEQYYCEKMPLIRHRTSVALRRHYPGLWRNDGLLCAVFNVDWDLREFLNNNYHAGIHQPLGEVITITGAVDNAQLCSISQYMEWGWPGQGDQIIRAIQQAIREAVSEAQKSSSGFVLGLSGSEKVTIQPDLRSIQVQGGESLIISAAQQIAWLAAACQEKPKKISYAYVNFSEAIQHDAAQFPVFEVSVKLNTAESVSSESCWNKIIGPAILITGFPICEREYDERGLEVSVGVMAQLLGISKAVTYNGGIVFKGRYSVVVPVKKTEHSIQWHVVDKHPRKLEWKDIDKVCPYRITTMIDIFNSRSFLGWCPKVLESLATAGYDFNSVQYSQASAPSQWAQIDKFQLGFSQWGTVTAEVTFGRKDGFYCRREADYNELLQDARATHIILYDTTHQRAAQTNAEDLILHMLLHRRALGKADADFNANGTVDELEFANPDRQTVPTRTAMISNAEKIYCFRYQFSSSEPKESLFKHEVKAAYSIIDGLWAKDFASETSNPLKLGPEIRHSTCGWEYMDVVNSSRHILPKSVKLRGSCGRWHRYAKDIKALVLFGSNFGDILAPASPDAVCPLFTSVPKDHSYLAIRVDTLQALFDRQGSLEDQLKLSSAGWSLSGSKDLFKTCAHQGHAEGKHCASQRLVRLAPSLLRGSHFKLPLEGDGAIIIGEADNDISQARVKGRLKANLQSLLKKTAS